MTTDSKHDSDILILAATGKTGRRVVERLRTQGAAVRAASRSSEVTFDWTAPATWEPALAGATALYLVAPDDPDPVEDFVRLAVESGVRRIVALSGRGLDRIGEDVGAGTATFYTGMAAAERAVRGSGVEWTIIRPNNFNQNFDEDMWRQPLRDGRLALPIGATPEPFIDADDVAAVAAALLTRDGDRHLGEVYELSGPRGLSFGEAVGTIARAAGREIAYVELTPEEYEAELLAEGYPEVAAKAFGALFALHRTGYTAAPVDGVQRVLGRAPTDFTAYAERAAAAGAWT
ncbi:NAD(P)H-binding protein [Streptomyces sp. XD-27]|uniref:NAD(P)H-binding protein n=1 Tax=Streptomyces sp. XD-27 TaxID=3062779 RepID=UPI0026F4779F|nr:NAD(P)H-binding protein [Streptomyces sp. XD-27]WKX71108.1 NAD(P)H-binding protein [Streptomyces sp. XD-27]